MEYHPIKVIKKEDIYKIILKDIEDIARRYKKIRKSENQSTDELEEILMQVEIGRIDIDLEDYDDIQKVLQKIYELSYNYPNLKKKVEIYMEKLKA